MEFLSDNEVNTTTVFTTASAGFTGSVANLFDRNTVLAWGSTGYTTNTSAMLSIYFGTNTIISHIFLQNHGLRQFRIFYNSLTANTFTPDINVSSNSATSSYFSFNSITVQSIHLQIDRSIDNDDERSVGEWFSGERRSQFDVNPAIENYKPVVFRKQVRHEMPDGGIKLYNVRDKFRADLKWEFITESFKTELATVFNAAQAVYFVPFPTTTGWDGDASEVVISGPFNFKYSSNVRDQGWSGSLRVEETPNT